jgi:hypothetical protein
MAKRKLVPVNPGAKVKSRSSFVKQDGKVMPADGSGARGTSKPKLNPTNGASSFKVKTGQSGKRGPINGSK